MKRKNFTLFLSAMAFCCSAIAQSVDYSVVYVNEEARTEFEMITTSNDYVCMPAVQRTLNGITWLTNKIVDVSADGNSIAFLSYRNNTTNVFMKDLKNPGESKQRTDRGNVLDFSFSPNGRYITFSERVGDQHRVFRTDAEIGYTCRQITDSNNDYSPKYSSDMKKLFFVRESQNGFNIRCYNTMDNFISNYTSGYNPCPVPSESAYICVRTNVLGFGEIWKVDYNTGFEKCLISDPIRSFTTPVLSPNGEYMLLVGSSPIRVDRNTVYWNTDIFVCRADGTRLTQLTHHAADDLSPTWSQNSKYIYFISQRGSSAGIANIWRMSFNHLILK